MTRELKTRELQLEQKQISLDAEEQLLALDVMYQEGRKEIQDEFDKDMKLFNAKVEVELAEYPEPITEPVKEEKEIEETA